MLTRVIVGEILLILALIALGFLAYTIINLESLRITIAHIRVIVGFSLFLVFLPVGVFLITSR